MTLQHFVITHSLNIYFIQLHLLDFILCSMSNGERCCGRLGEFLYIVLGKPSKLRLPRDFNLGAVGSKIINEMPINSRICQADRTL